MKLLKKGNFIGIVAENEYNGEIVFLSPYQISVQLKSPVGSIISKWIPETYRDKVRFAVKIENEYVATETGVYTALDLLMRIGKEEDTLLNQPLYLQDMIDEYRKKEAEFRISSKTINGKEEHQLIKERDEYLGNLKMKYFPDLNEIRFGEELIGKLEQYLKEYER